MMISSSYSGSGFEVDPPQEEDYQTTEFGVNDFRHRGGVCCNRRVNDDILSCPRNNEDSFNDSLMEDTRDEDEYDEDAASADRLLSYLPPHNSYNPEGTNTFYTIFLIVNAALGAGLLNFPKAYDAAGGISVAVIVQAVLIIFIVGALLILAFCADRCESGAAATIQETMQGVTGSLGRILTSVCVIVYCFGTTITFLIIIGDQLDRALSSLYPEEFCNVWYLDRRFTLPLSSVILILPMCYSRRIDFLRIPSAFGVIAILYTVSLVVYKYYTGEFRPGPIKTHPTRWSDVFLVVPVICFGYQCHVSVIPIYSCMKNRSLKHFSVASIAAIFICLVCYTLAASYGYLTFGGDVDEDILMSYSASSPPVMAAVVAVAFKTITTYPILLFCGREASKTIIEDAGGAFWLRYNHGNSGKELIIRVVVSTMWFIFSLLLAVMIPNIGDVIGLLGSLAAVFIFALPGLCLFAVSYRADPSFVRKRSLMLVTCSFIYLAIGAFVFGVVFTQSLQNLTSSSGKSVVSEFVRRTACGGD